jgi:hypothetical protein
MKSKVLANCADYNGYKNVLFMMEADDFRLHNPVFEYTVISDAKYNRKTKTLVADGKTYFVCQDWSVKVISE